MSHPLSSCVPLFAMSGFLCSSALREIPEAQADRRLHAGTNSARGLAVHLAMARHGMAQLLGARLDPLPWKDVGEGFEAGFKPGAALPSMATLAEVWAALDRRYPEILLGASAAALAAPSPLPIPGKAAPTVADFAALNVVHESYHTGQLGLLAKAINGKGLFRKIEGKEA